MPSLVSYSPIVDIQPVTDVVRIQCPYCPTGGTLLPMQKGAVEKIRIEGVHDPRKCDTCDRYFKLNIRVVVEGAKIEGE